MRAGISIISRFIKGKLCIYKTVIKVSKQHEITLNNEIHVVNQTKQKLFSLQVNNNPILQK